MMVGSATCLASLGSEVSDGDLGFGAECDVVDVLGFRCCSAMMVGSKALPSSGLAVSGMVVPLFGG